MGCVYQARNNKGNAAIYFLKYKTRNDAGEWEWTVESTGQTDKAEAKRILRERETAVDAGRPVAKTVGRKNLFTFEAAITAIVADYKLNNAEGSDRDVEARILRHLAPVFGKRRMDSITTDEIAKYAADRLEAGAAPGQVKLELMNLSRMFSLGIKASRLSWRPAMPTIKVDNARQGFFERADFDAVLKRMPAHTHDLLTLAYWSGWRTQSELATLEWRHVDQDAREIRIFTSKNGDGRVFPYGSVPAVVALIERAAARREVFRDKGVITARLFVDDNGAALTKTFPSKPRPQLVPELREAWRSACTLAGVGSRDIHDFRRTAVRALVAAGVAEKVAMKITGHKTRAVFDRYHIVNTTDLHEALGRLAAHKARGTVAGRQTPARGRRRASGAA